MGANHLLRQFLALEKQRLGVNARVGSALFLDLNCRVTQLEIEFLLLETTSEGFVIPHAIVAEHLAVVVQE